MLNKLLWLFQSVRDQILTQSIILPAQNGPKLLSRINTKKHQDTEVRFGKTSSRKDITRNSDYIRVKVTSNFHVAEPLISFAFAGAKNVVKSAQKDQLALLWSQ